MDTGSPKQPHPLQYKIADQQTLGPPPGTYVDYAGQQFDVYDSQGSAPPPATNSPQQMQQLGVGPGPVAVSGVPAGHPGVVRRGPSALHVGGLTGGAGQRKPSPSANGLIIREDGVAISSNGVPLDTSTLYGALPPGAAPSHHGHHSEMEPPPPLMMSGSPAPPGIGPSNSAAAAAVAAAAALQRRGTKRKILHLASPAVGQRASPVNNEQNEEEPDTELRRAAVHSLRYSLDQCAQHVREDEESALAEKSRQVFGMTWLLRSCETDSDSNVPRNRIYARYVTVCAELNLKPLNPASFGKLVRIIFPGIKTRRLGVRGQSKYHYCGITLIGSDTNPTGSTPNTSMATRTPSPDSTPGAPQRAPSTTPMANQQFGEYTRQLYDYSQNNGSPGGAAAAAAAAAAAGPPASAPPSGPPGPPGAVDAVGDPNGLSEQTNGFSKFKPTASLEEFAVPRIGDYLSPDVDPDAAATLQGLYTSHCRTLLDQLRFMHIKKFFSLVSGFIRGLTSPVQRLLKHPDTIRWMADTDRRLYSEMLLLLAPLVLQSLPTEVSQGLHALAASLPSQLQNQGMQLGDDFVAAKKDAAAPFVDLIDRLLRANDAAQNVSRILLNSAEVVKMKQDWAAYVTPVAAREAPCAQKAVVQILLHEIPSLLIDVKVDDASRLSISDTLDPWVQYLNNLPKRVMHRLSPALFKTVCSAVATAALRDLNRGGCSSFGAWWVLRCWVDEYMAWQLELEGILQPHKQQDLDDVLAPEHS